MKSAVWTRAIKACADPQRARHFLNLLGATAAREALSKLAEPEASVLTALFSGSQAVSNLLIAHPDWLPLLESDALKFPRRKQGLEQEVNRLLKRPLAVGDFGTVLARVREFKEREMLRIGARD